MTKRAFVLFLAFLAPQASALAQTLIGAIDIHAHTDPDGVPRSIDAIDLAKLAKSRGMRAIVLKNHYEPTASLAYIVRKEVPGIEVFGGISLDLTVGGVNPAAVEWMTKVKGGYGRVVWMPTFDSEHNAEPQHRPFARVAQDGKLVPAVVQVIAIIAKHHLTLETGHSSPEECLMIIREGKRQGVENMVVTHAIASSVGMSIAQMQEAARLGAYLELVYIKPGTAEALTSAKAIRAVGPEHCILSSDLGQAGNPLHPDGLLAFYRYLKQQGFSVAEIDRMAKTNPARALGLKP
ncbi:MAG TPA: DUF6282 family protein [Bryobacteraceae bacterium]|nr:DUF6282 family protein [Bryobacteraceae bacterium]